MRLKWRDMLTMGTNANFADPLYAPWISSVGASAQNHWNSLNTTTGRTFLWNDLRDLGTDSSDISGSYNRLRTMALGYAVRGSTLEGNASLRAAIVSALDWLHLHHFNTNAVIFDNWFDFQIATPLALNDITALLYSDLTPAQVANYMGAVHHFTPEADLTAANKTWKAFVIALRGILVKDGTRLDAARAALSDVFTPVTSGDGWYADGSFVFHNFFPYNGGYGVEMIGTLAATMQLLEGSPWPVNDPAHTNLFRWVRDGCEPFLVNGALMQMVSGRYFTRTGDDHREGHDLLAAILRVAQLAPPEEAAAMKALVKGSIQADTYRKFVATQPPPYNVWAAAVLNDVGIAPGIAAPRHRQFPGMDRVVHRGDGWTIGIAMSSSRIANYESTRGENLRGWFTAEGMAYLYNGDLGHFADDFWPAVDPYRLPGTTIDAVPRADSSGDSYRSPNNQTGGASILDRYGIVAMHLNAWGSTLSARKSWYFFDDEIVCLGTGISSSDGRRAETIIENRRLGVYGNNAFTVNGEVKPTGPGWSEAIANPGWAHLAGSALGADVGYWFPQGMTLHAKRESRSGALRDLNTTYGSATRSTRHFLTLWCDHGTNPTGGTYAYVLLPNRSTTAVAAYASSPDITILENTTRAQAVRENRLGITAINFWRDGSNRVSGISADRKSSLILRTSGGVLDVGVSDPTQSNAVIHVDLGMAATFALSADPGVSVVQMAPTLQLSINTSNQFGRTLRARFFLGALQTNTILPEADAHVQNGTHADSNFGTSSTLGVKATGANQVREAFLRFDLSPVQGTILGATLRVTPVTVNDALYHALAPVADDAWSENGITWNTRPAPGPEFTNWLVGAAGAPLFVPIAPLVAEAAAENSRLSLRLRSTGVPVPVNGGFTAYASRENSALNRPQLTVVSVRQAPGVVLTSPADGATLEAPGTVMVRAEAADPDGDLARVDFFRNGELAGQAAAAPHAVNVSGLPAGEYDFTAVAGDRAGLRATSALVRVSVFLREPSGRGTGLNADYFSDQHLRTLALSRVDTNVNFGWGVGAPAPGVPTDRFSVRWSGKLQARRAGGHQFHTVTDEGVRLWLDGRLLIDNWSQHLQTEDSASITLVPGRYYDVVMEYFDATASAVARLLWTEPGGVKEAVPTSQLYPADRGLRATYFNSTNFTAPVLSRIDETVNFAWGNSSPEPAAIAGGFSARWIGKLRPSRSGLHTFFTLSDDAVRLWINGQLIMSNSAAQALVESSNSITLAAGQSYDLALEFLNAAGAATMVLMWQPPGEARRVIPAAHLTPHQDNAPPSLAFIPNQVASRGRALTIAFAASDPDAPAQSLTFSLDAGAPAGASVQPANGVFTWTPSTAHVPGVYHVTARVTDNGSPAMTDAQTFAIQVLSDLESATVTLVRTGSVWRYLDTGVDAGTAWRAHGFNDANWKSGRARLGYGSGNEATVIGYGPNAANKYITAYFRRTFYVPDAARVQSLGGRLLRDDGGVVYLNGAEVWRNNMPAGAITFSTLASSAITGAGEAQFITATLDHSALVSGTNIVAVEIHQESPSSPDARFDLELNAMALVPAQPTLRVLRAGETSWLTWPEESGLLRVYSTVSLVPPVMWQALDVSPSLQDGSWFVPLPSTTNGTVFFRLQTP